MKKGGVLLKVFLFFGLLVINGQSAALCDPSLPGNTRRQLLYNQDCMEKSPNNIITDCVPGTWTGATDKKWHTATNWCDGQVPTSLTNVIIPSVTNRPVIYSEAECNNLTIQSGAYLTVDGSNTLTISGDFVNNGTFNTNSSTVIYNGNNQKVGDGTYNNLTFRGQGLKTINQDKVTLKGIISMEEMATISKPPGFSSWSGLQYNTPINRTTGVEWLSSLKDVSITIKNTGIVTLSESKELTKSSDLIVEENATLDLSGRNIKNPKSIYLKCGGLINGSSIIGTGKLYIDGMNLNVSDAGHGTAGAVISCPIDFSGTNIFNIANDAANVFTDTDLTVTMTSIGGSLTKRGNGTLNLKNSIMNLSIMQIEAGNVTIPVGAQIKIGSGTYVTPANGLTIESDINGSGSLIGQSFAENGIALVERYMTPGAWHMVSSPVSGQLISSFLSSNISIPSDGSNVRAMRDYNPGLNLWNDFFTNETGGNLIAGHGYCMRVRTSQEHKVSFKGKLQMGDFVLSGLTADKWNCIGNPYTSAMKINFDGYTHTFLGINSLKLDPSYGAIYIWDQPDANNGMADKYTIISNASPPFQIQQGQAFMVKMAIGKTSVDFKSAMQNHNSTLTLKSTDNFWPTIELKATADTLISTTIIAFHEGMTPGLDPTYDAGLLKVGDEMSLYTLLMEDPGIPFAIQALPAEYETIVVPLGMDGVKNGQVILSAELLQVPPTCQAILEDRLNKTFTDLTVNSYSANLMGNTSSQGRFFLHTSSATTKIGSTEKIHNLRAWTVSNHEIKISGETGSKAKAILYDIQGRQVLSEPLQAGLTHTIKLPEMIPGVYILKVRDMENMQVLKLFVGK